MNKIFTLVMIVIVASLLIIGMFLAIKGTQLLTLI